MTLFAWLWSLLAMLLAPHAHPAPAAVVAPVPVPVAATAPRHHVPVAEHPAARTVVQVAGPVALHPRAVAPPNADSPVCGVGQSPAVDGCAQGQLPDETIGRQDW